MGRRNEEVAVTEEQIVGVLREQEAGAKTADVCRKHGISPATFYQWKAKFGGLEVSEEGKGNSGQRLPSLPFLPVGFQHIRLDAKCGLPLAGGPAPGASLTPQRLQQHDFPAKCVARNSQREE